MDNMTNLVIEFLRNREEVFREIKEGKNIHRFILGAILTILFLGAIYGAIMGLFSGGFVILMDMIKVPLLFLISLIATFPAYFIIETVVGLEISFRQMLAILSIGFAIASTVLLAFTPLVFFYSISESSYTLIHTLHYILFSLAGLCGAYYLALGIKKTSGEKEIGYRWLVPLLIGGIITALIGIKLAWLLRPYFHYHHYFFEGLGIIL